MTFNILCSTFLNLQSNENGTILRIKEGKVLFSNNYVFSVSSTTYPGCIYVNNLDSFDLSKTTFSQCYGDCQNKDDHPANVLSSETIEISTINDISAYQCSPYQTKYADSVFYLYNQTTFIQSCNTSFCYGQLGSS